MNTDSQINLMRDQILACMTDGCDHSDAEECYATVERMADELRTRTDRRFDGRALFLACVIIGEALHEDCGLQTWWDSSFKELGVDRMTLYEMSPTDRTKVLIEALRGVAKNER